MSNIELLIKIDENAYKEIKKIVADGNEMCFMQKLIANSIPLPKGHGRLIDADELKKEYPHDTDWDYPVNTNCGVVESIDTSPTIIKADKGE